MISRPYDRPTGRLPLSSLQLEAGTPAWPDSPLNLRSSQRFVATARRCSGGRAAGSLPRAAPSYVLDAEETKARYRVRWKGDRGQHNYRKGKDAQASWVGWVWRTF